MSAPALFTGARLVDPASGRDELGWLRVENGVIAALGAGAPPPMAGVAVREARGHALAPALIDLSVEVRVDPAAEHETVETASAAALAGGVGAFIARPCGGAAFDAPEDIAAIPARAAPVRALPAAAATLAQAGERLAPLALLREAGARLVTTGSGPIAEARAARAVFTAAAHLRLPVAVRPEEPGLAAGGVAHDGAFAERLALPTVPALAEPLQVERDSRLAAAAGAAILFDQLSSAGGVAAVRRAKERAPHVSATVSAAHLAFNELDVGDFDPRFRLSPPVRAESDRQALIDGVRTGDIDAIVSGHAACSREDKRAPFPDAAPGGAGLETLLAASLALTRDGGLSLAEALAPLTCRPASLIGLQQGRLAVGAPADLIVFDPEAPWRCRAETLVSRTKVSPFDGRLLQGRVRLTMIAGVAAYEDAGERAPLHSRPEPTATR
ncbi:MAG: amidohydrolase family protein [Caulobacterales bacterium]|nr:amidohydrolase family protein [Caulobacterales bacterium]